jgi:hypothetical protein
MNYKTVDGACLQMLIAYIDGNYVPNVGMGVFFVSVLYVDVVLFVLEGYKWRLGDIPPLSIYPGCDIQALVL